jgi:Group II intron, maturase-specific domain
MIGSRGRARLVVGAGQVLHQLQPSGQQSCRDRNAAGDELWRLHLRSDKALDDLAHMWNPVLRGWINY